MYKNYLLVALLTSAIQLSAQEDPANLTTTDTVITHQDIKALSLETLELLALEDNAKAMFELSMRYLQGRGGVAKDMRTATSWADKAAAAGHAGAQYEMGLYYLKFVAPADIQKGKDYLLASAAQGDIRSKAYLVKKLIEGIAPFTQDIGLGLRYAVAAARKQEPNAQAYLGMLILNGNYVSKNVGEAAWLISSAADQGNSMGLYYKGYLAKEGIVLAQNPERAVQLWELSVAKGYDRAHYALGYMLYKGLGAEQDYRRAFNLFQTGANYGDQSAMLMLAVSHALGNGTTQSDADAETWFQRSIEGKPWYDQSHRIFKAFKQGMLTNDILDALAGGLLPEVEGLELPDTFETITSQLIPGTKLTGVWKGLMGIYDWSGVELREKHKVKLRIKQNGNQLKGQFVLDDTIKTSFEGKMEGSKLTFSKGKYTYPDPTGIDLITVLKALDLDITGIAGREVMRANLKTRIPSLKEKGKPTYLVMSKKEEKNRISILKEEGFANMQVKLKLIEDADVEVFIVNMHNEPIATLSSGALIQGKHSFSYDGSSLEPGIYVVSAQVNGERIWDRFKK